MGQENHSVNALKDSCASQREESRFQVLITIVSNYQSTLEKVKLAMDSIRLQDRHSLNALKVSCAFQKIMVSQSQVLKDTVLISKNYFALAIEFSIESLFMSLMYVHEAILITS